MLNTVRSAVNYPMVVGKLLILLAASPVLAFESDPKFFDYRGGSFSNRLVETAFGWFRTLNDEQKIAYNQALTHALLYAENGHAVRWYKDDASGSSMPAMTWPSGAGYCRRMHIQTTAYNVEKTMKATACYDGPQDNWTWVSDK